MRGYPYCCAQCGPRQSCPRARYHSLGASNPASAAGKPDSRPAGVTFASSYNQRADLTACASGFERNWAMRPRCSV